MKNLQLSWIPTVITNLKLFLYYSFFQSSYWNPKQDQDNSPRSKTMEGEDARNHEPEPVGLKPGITITNLR